MISRLFAKTPAWLFALFWIVALVLKDWESLSPRSPHADFRFQVIGEFLEVLALGLLGRLLRHFVKEGDDPQIRFSTFRPRVIFAGAFAILLFILCWRDFFPNDRFNLSAGSMDFLYAPLGGLGVIAISYILGEREERPGKGTENSVV